jgi:hypothetical protein
MLNSIKILFSLIFLFFITLGFSQENQTTIKETKIPESIYHISTKVSTDLNNSLTINNRLNLKSLKFIAFNKKSIEEGYFTIPLFNLDYPRTKFIYDSYNRVYQNAILEQAFFKVSDLYRVRAKNPI